MKASGYEAGWIVFSVLAVIMFLSIVGIYAVGTGFSTPQHAEVVDPTDLPYFTYGSPRVQEKVPGEEYEVYVIAQMYSFQPNPIVVPAGAEVTFHVTSTDVVHGMEIIGSNINLSILPGYITTVTTTFDTPGEYGIICHEYCGSGHHLMRGTLIVEGSA